MHIFAYLNYLAGKLNIYLPLSNFNALAYNSLLYSLHFMSICYTESFLLSKYIHGSVCTLAALVVIVARSSSLLILWVYFCLYSNFLCDTLLISIVYAK